MTFRVLKQVGAEFFIQPVRLTAEQRIHELATVRLVKVDQNGAGLLAQLLDDLAQWIAVLCTDPCRGR